MPKHTQTIAGRPLTLVARARYRASRPIAPPEPVSVTVQPMDRRSDAATVTLEGFTLEQADQFIAAFNNGQTSFDGRLWHGE